MDGSAFPTLIAIITMFFVGFTPGILPSLASALLLTGVIMLGIAFTLLSSKLLSSTILKGVPSSFTLELPPYRKPQIGKVIIRSIFDRTIYVLGRAVLFAAPAGLVIWLMANIKIDQTSLLILCSSFLDPFAKLLGLDGIILLAFILGFPANEIVMPIIIMAYSATSTITDMSQLNALKSLLIENDWTYVTAISFLLFSLLHWPCSTTCMTIKKETGSMKWTLLAFFLPTVFGILTCMIFNGIVRIFS